MIFTIRVPGMGNHSTQPDLKKGSPIGFLTLQAFRNRWVPRTVEVSCILLASNLGYTSRSTQRKTDSMMYYQWAGSKPSL